jgi:hypothetical protein
MNKAIEHLKKYDESLKPEARESDLLWYLYDASPVWEGAGDEHRWITYVPTVVEIDGMLIEFCAAHPGGESYCVSDHIEDNPSDIDDIYEVVAKEVMTTTYVRKDKIKPKKAIPACAPACLTAPKKEVG